MSVDVCTEYSTALAVVDYAPVLLAGAGAAVVGQAVGRTHPRAAAPVYVGAVLMTTGGACKATWKLLVSLPGCYDVPLLAQILFPLLVPGFALVAWGLLGLVKGRVTPVWPFALVVALALGGAVAVGSTAVLIPLAAVGALFIGVCLVVLARRRDDRLTIVLVTVYVVGSFVLPPLSRGVQTGALAWGEEICNTIVQGSFLLAALRLSAARTAEARTAPQEVRP